MDMEKQPLDDFIKWLDTCQIKAPHNTIDELKDGLAIIEILMQIDPEWFTENWKKHIINVNASTEQNLDRMQKIIDSATEYYKNYLIENPCVDLNAKKILEEYNTQEIYDLLRLIFSCAVKCQRKNDFIEIILQTNPNMILQVLTVRELTHKICDINHATFLFKNLPGPKNKTKKKDTLNQRLKETPCDLCTIIVDLYSGKNSIYKWSYKYRQLQKKTLKLNQEILSLMMKHDELLSEQLHTRESQENKKQSEKGTGRECTKCMEELYRFHNKRINEKYELSANKLILYSQELKNNITIKLNSLLKEIESIKLDQIDDSGQNIENQGSQLSADKVNLETKTVNINIENVGSNYVEELEKEITDRDALLTEAAEIELSDYSDNKREFDSQEKMDSIRNKDPLVENINENEEKECLPSVNDFEIIEPTNIKEVEGLSSSLSSSSSLRCELDDAIRSNHSDDKLKSD